MIQDTSPVSKWLVQAQGFRTLDECRNCSSHEIMYFKVREVGLKGFASECQSCGKKLSVRMRRDESKSIHPEKKLHFS